MGSAKGNKGVMGDDRDVRATAIEIPRDRVAEFCGRWRVTEFALFGSVLREDFGPDSDVDVLVSFDSGAPWSLWHLIDMQDELNGIFGRRVDLVEKKAIRNPIRRREILSTHRVIHVAAQG